MISFDLPDLDPAENPVACVLPDDYGVIDTSDLDTVRRDDPMSRRRELSAGDRATRVLVDVVRGAPNPCELADDSTLAARSGWARDSGMPPTLVADEGADRRAGQPVVADVECLDVHGLGLMLPNGRALLSNVSFSARPGSLTAIIGPSGAGKSTLAKLVGGAITPTAGEVSFGGHDLHAEYASLRHRIGLVPQDDVVHHQLTLDAALRFAAELRLPHATKDQRREAVRRVLEELELTSHAHTRVDRLSGGQRKRASVAMELLTGPSLLILDEPTTGLDPALDRQVMTMLRRLADAGRVVLVVTHCLTHLDVCDQVVFLAPGGKTAYCGPPREIGAALGTTNWADLFASVGRRPRRGPPRVCGPLPRRGTGGQVVPAASRVLVAAGAVSAAAPGVHRGPPPTAAHTGRSGLFPVPGGAAVRPGHARAAGARPCRSGYRQPAR